MAVDRVQLRVQSILYEAARSAYGYVPLDEREELPACDGCGGDGCEACHFTGDPQ